MTLAGTRPPTVDEWDKYELHHRARLATKPGLTGMWQVSGRSNITDFEEVVKLDKQYISEWTMGLDMVGVIFGSRLVFQRTCERRTTPWSDLRLGTFQLSDLCYNTLGGAIGGVLYWMGWKVKKQ